MSQAWCLEETLQELNLSFDHVVPGIWLRSSVLVARTYTCWLVLVAWYLVLCSIPGSKRYCFKACYFFLLFPEKVFFFVVFSPVWYFHGLWFCIWWHHLLHFFWVPLFRKCSFFLAGFLCVTALVLRLALVVQAGLEFKRIRLLLPPECCD